MDDWWLDTLNTLMAAQSGRKYNLHFEPTTTSQQATNLRINIKWNSQYYLGTCDGGQPGQIIKVDRIVAICQQPIPPGPVILINPLGEGTSNPSVPWMAYAPRINQEASTRIVQNIRKRPKDKLQPIDPAYAILYIVDKEESTEFWVANEAYELLIHTLNKRLEVQIPDAQQGYYLAVWGELKYSHQNSTNLYSDSIRVRFTTYESPPDKLISGQDINYPDAGINAYFQQFSLFGFPQRPILTALVPRPTGLVDNFTGVYHARVADVYNHIFSNQPIKYDFDPAFPNQQIYKIESSLIPSDAILRSTLEFDFGPPTNDIIGSTNNKTLYEYTGYNINLGFTTWEQWIVPEGITSKGFSKDDLVVVTDFGQARRVLAPASVNPITFNGAALEGNHLTYGYIPWGQEPGSGWPKSNRISFGFTSGIPGLSNSRNYQQGWRNDSRINFTAPSGAQLYYYANVDQQPPLLFDGRNFSEPNEPQKILITQSYEAYLSSTSNKNVAFYIKSNNKGDDPFISSASQENTEYQQTQYKHIQTDGTIVEYDTVGVVDITDLSGSIVTNDPTNSSVLSLIRYGFRDWKGYLSSKKRTFQQVLSPITSDQNNSSFSINFLGRHKQAASIINTQGWYLGERLYIVAPFSQIVNFLNNEENEAESANDFVFTITNYELSANDNAVTQSSASSLWNDYEINLIGDEAETTVAVIKPIEFTKFLESGTGVAIIDIIPLVEE